MENKIFFWAMIFVTGIVGLYWAIMSALGQPHPLYIAFAVVNSLCLLVNAVCLVLDLRWNKK